MTLTSLPVAGYWESAMQTVSTSPDIVADSATGGISCGNNPAKWFVTIDDRRIPVPRRRLKVTVLRAQAGISEDRVLVRDHNSPEDEVLRDDAEIDCAQGNVFYTEARCDARSPVRCLAPAKIAFSVDDRVEETLNHSQTGTTLLDLCGLDRNRALFRDHESAVDQAVKPDDPLRFEDGPVFYTRGHTAPAGLTIIVNSRKFGREDGVHQGMTAKAIAGLITKQPADFDTYAGPVAQGQPLPPDEPVKLHDCDVFTVIKKTVDGGYSTDRIQAEIARLREGGANVELIEAPTPVVLYRGLPARPGLGADRTDVLVPVPSGYPGQHLDWAFLPDGSPFAGRVVGGVTGNALTADNRTWRQISYHPHNGGGFPPWNPSVHGFHTYIDALLAWLARWK